jgi:RNA polymerase subunit RPABC4/transcription elongation factor Spt4
VFRSVPGHGSQSFTKLWTGTLLTVTPVSFPDSP